MEEELSVYEEPELEMEDPPEERPNRKRRTLIITCSVLLVIAFCCTLVAGLALWADPFDWNLLARITGRYDGAAEAVPADADMYIGLDLLQLRSEQAERVFKAFAEVNPDAEFASTTDFLSRLDEAMDLELGITFSENILPWVGQHAGIGVMNVNPADLGNGDEPDFVFVATVRDQAEAEIFVGVLKSQLAEDSGEPISEETYEGGTIFSVQDPTGGNGIAFSLYKNVFLMSMKVSSIQAAIDAKKGESFMDTPDFADLSGLLPGGRIATFFITQNLLTNAAEEFTRFSAGSQALSGNGMWRNGAFSLSFVPAGIELDFAVLYDGEKMTDLQRELIRSYGGDFGMDDRLPANTLMFLGGRRLDLAWQLLREQTAASGVGADMDEAMVAFQQEFGFNPDTDLFPNLDGEFVLAVMPSADGMLASDLFNIDLGLVLAFETGNPDGLAPVISAIDSLISSELGADPVTVDVNGFSMQQASDPFVGEMLAYGLIEDVFLVTSAVSTAEGLLDGGASLDGDAEYQAVWRAFPGDVKPFFYMNVAGLLGTIREGLDPASRSGFDSEFAGMLEPIQYIAMANQYSGADTQLATIVIFIAGGTK